LSIRWERVRINLMKVRTRIAPSPTGENLHIGNAYTALINYVVARQNKGTFIVRIEDTDRTRLVPGSEQRILESLSWLGLSPDESPVIGGPFAPYRQSDRLSHYKKYAEELIGTKHAYYCFCTPKRLEEMRNNQEIKHLPPMYDGLCKKLKPDDARARADSGEKHVIRLNVPDTGITKFQDLIRGEISFENGLIDDQVLLKSDGFPTYHLGVVVDDHIMEISHIIRGEEWISSTPKHILLYEFFGWDKPIYAHMPLLRNPDKSKLSKRKNPVWVSWYKEQGFLKEALINYLATMAWAYPGGQEIFSREDMIREFKLDNIQTTAPIFNLEKLRWMNGEYIRKMSDTALRDTVYAFDSQIPKNDSKMGKIIPLVKERMKTLKEFWSLAGFFFEEPKEIEIKVNPLNIGIAIAALESVQNNWSHDSMEAAIRSLAEEKNQKPKEVFMDLRVMITGKTVGPPLLESLEILGKDETLSRLTV
jgi:glutamyl-tRNA synthetase